MFEVYRYKGEDYDTALTGECMRLLDELMSDGEIQIRYVYEHKESGHKFSVPTDLFRHMEELERLEKVTKKADEEEAIATATAPKFKVGDRVIIREEWGGWDDSQEPTVGKIGRIDDIDCYSAKVVLDDDFWRYTFDKLELANNDEGTERSYEERQAEWVEKVDLKPGDKVRILRRFESWENGVPFSFNDITMTDLIGEICEVFEIADNRIRVYDKHRVTYWVWPYFCLEKVAGPEYVPFDLSKEEDRNFLRGKWIKSEEREAMITAFHTLPDGKWTVDCSNFINSTADGLLRFYTFLDGSPVGKQMASK